MTLLQQLIEEPTPNLTDVQKGMMAAVFSAATPEQAYEVANGTSLTTTAKNQLIAIGLLQQINNTLVLTPDGNQALISNNLLDDTGELTDEGKEQLDAMHINKQEYINLESYPMLKSFYL